MKALQRQARQEQSDNSCRSCKVGKNTRSPSPYSHSVDLYKNSGALYTPSPNLYGAENHSTVQRKCESCASEQPSLPQSVFTTLNTPGRPLGGASRRSMETSFDHDFGDVRIHDDSLASQSAYEIGATAYTHGNHIVFGSGMYAPQTSPGRALLAHELAHVVQQRGTSAEGVSPKLTLGSANSAAEQEADRAVRQVMLGEKAHVERVRNPSQIQRWPCNRLLFANESTRVAEADVRDRLVPEVKRHGTVKAEMPIPGGSFGSYRPNPSQTSGRTGFIDIALISGGVLDILELKVARPSRVSEGVTQLHHYVTTANSPENSQWRAERGISSAREMPVGRFALRSPLTVKGEPVSLAWCTPGFLVFKAIRDQDPDITLCSAPAPALDQFIDRAVDGALTEVDNYLDQIIDPVWSSHIDSVPLRDLLHEIVNQPGLRGNPFFDQLLDRVDDEFLNQSERLIRDTAQRLKAHLLNRIRQHMHSMIRQYLERSFAALCVTVSAVALATLLEKFRQDLPSYFGEAVQVVVPQVAHELLEAALTLVAGAIAALILTALVVALVIYGLVKAAAAAAAAVTIKGLLGLGSFIAQWLLRLLPRMPRLPRIPIFAR